MTLRTKTLVALMTTTVLGFATTASAQDGWAGEASLISRTVSMRSGMRTGIKMISARLKRATISVRVWAIRSFCRPRHSGM